MAKARGTAGVAVPRPFEQGDLDGLCGVYAVVNAVRHAAYPHRRLSAAESRGLFAALLAELADEGRLRGFVAAGLAVRLRWVCGLWAGGDPIRPGDGGPTRDGHDRARLLWALVGEAEALDATAPRDVSWG